MNKILSILILLGIFSQNAFSNEEKGCFEHYKIKADKMRVEVTDLVRSNDISMYNGITFENSLKGAVVTAEDAIAPCTSLENSLRQLDLSILHAQRNINN